MKTIIIPIIISIAAVSLPAPAETLHDPADYNTIQSAIDAAQNGDTVLIAPGRYTGAGNRDIDFLGKAITVTSASGPDNCIIDCEGIGGGFVFENNEDTNSVLSGVTIMNSSSLRPNGSAISCWGGSPRIENCVMRDNNGCAIIFRDSGSTTEIANCLVVRNGDSGIVSFESPAIINSCIIAQNKFAGIYAGGFLQITNCIIQDNEAEQIYEHTKIVVSYSNVQGGFDGEGNIDADPCFAFNDDYHLLPSSPCLDSGDPNYFAVMGETDLDGNPRILDGDGDSIVVVDMGTYEFNPSHPSIAVSPQPILLLLNADSPGRQSFYVRNCGGGTLDWSIFENCEWLKVYPVCGSSHGQINEVMLTVDSNLVTLGDYTCTLTITAPDAINSPLDVRVKLNVARTLHVPGNFPVIQNAVNDANDYDVVIIAPGTYTGDGNRDIDFLGKAITVRSIDPNNPNIVASTIIDCNGTPQEDHSAFIFQNHEGTDSILEGLTITNASGKLWGSGAIRCVDSAARISRCVIRDNNTRGILCCTDRWKPIIRSIIDNCTIVRNERGIVCIRSTRADIRSCLIAENETDGIGGAGYLHVNNCTIVANGRFGLYGSSYTGSNITNCIIRGNGSAEIKEGSTVIVTYCNIEGGFSGEGNIDVEPRFALDGDYHLSAKSPCIDAGTNDPCGGLALTDIDGNPRILDGNDDGYSVADMGAFEFNPCRPSIAISPKSLFFVHNLPNPDPQFIYIRNCGGGRLNWKIIEQCEWLRVCPEKGNSTGEIDKAFVIVDSAKLEPGKYTYYLTVLDPNAVNRSQTISITLQVGRILSVPYKFATIQAAINDANDYDIVLVADGLYTGDGNRDIYLSDKAITVRSENGPQNCIIDCNASLKQPHTGFSIDTNKSVHSVLNGFTVTRAQYSAIRLHGGNVLVVDCVVKNNFDIGIVAGSSAGQEVQIIDCIVSGNMDSGVACGSGAVTIRGCRITNNFNNRGGGGIYIDSRDEVTVSLINSVIAENTGSYGGGLSAEDAMVTINGCVISDNTALHKGGALFSSGVNHVIRNTYFIGNRAGKSGGAIDLDRADLSISNSAFIGNLAGSEGGAITCRTLETYIANSTFAENWAPKGCSFALESYENRFPGDLRLNGCILAGNFEPILNLDNSNVSIQYSNVRSGWAGDGNIDAEPCFVRAGYWADVNDANIVLEPNEPNAVWVDGDYRLLGDSACIDAGEPNYLGAAGETDLDGRLRVVDGDEDGLARVDMGAYEYVPPIEVRIRIMPRVLNLRSRGRWVLCKITLPAGCNVGEIDRGSILLEGQIEPGRVFASERLQAAIALFSRAELVAILQPGWVVLAVTGRLKDGTEFEGTAGIGVIPADRRGHRHQGK